MQVLCLHEKTLNRKTRGDLNSHMSEFSNLDQNYIFFTIGFSFGFSFFLSFLPSTVLICIKVRIYSLADTYLGISCGFTTA
jgi:hypothetical protein